MLLFFGFFFPILRLDGARRFSKHFTKRKRKKNQRSNRRGRRVPERTYRRNAIYERCCSGEIKKKSECIAIRLSRGRGVVAIVRTCVSVGRSLLAGRPRMTSPGAAHEVSAAKRFPFRSRRNRRRPNDEFRWFLPAARLSRRNRQAFRSNKWKSLFVYASKTRNTISLDFLVSLNAIVNTTSKRFQLANVESSLLRSFFVSIV